MGLSVSQPNRWNDNGCCAKEDGFVILTDRKEEQNNDKYPKASLAAIKVIKFGRISAGMEHWCVQLCRLRTRVTYGNREFIYPSFKYYINDSNNILVSLINQIHMFTIFPEEHIMLYVRGFCTCNCDENVMKGHIADHLDLLICEQTEKHPKDHTVVRWSAYQVKHIIV